MARRLWKAARKGVGSSIADQAIEADIVHVIQGLDKGGSETMLYQFLKRSEYSAGRTQMVLSLGEGGYYRRLIEDLQVRVHELPIRSRPLRSLWLARTQLRKASLIVSWNYHSHVVSFFAKPRRARAIWFVRHADTSWANNSHLTYAIMRFCVLLSVLPERIVYNGDAARINHERLGYSSVRSTVVPNGCDTDEFRPLGPGARNQLNRDLEGALSGRRVVLSAARWHSIKDHRTFLQALKIVRTSDQTVLGVLCGKGITEDNESLLDLIKECRLSIGRDLILLGERDDLPVILSSSDVYVLHSASEAFPNTLIQALAAGTRVVATTAASSVVKAKGVFRMVEVGNPSDLAKEILRVISSTHGSLDPQGRTGRQVVLEEYSIERVLAQYDQLLRENQEF